MTGFSYEKMSIVCTLLALFCGSLSLATFYLSQWSDDFSDATKKVMVRIAGYSFLACISVIAYFILFWMIPAWAEGFHMAVNAKVREGLS